MKNNNNIKAIIFDLSGTLIDFGSLATIYTMKNVFKEKKILIFNETIQKDMGIKKINHIKKIINYPKIRSEWYKIYKKKITTKQIKEISLSFDKRLVIEVNKRLNIIPNVKKLFKILRKNNIKIGATTGYPKKITKLILNYLKKNKIFLDYCISDDEVKKSRPSPDMCLKNLRKFKVKHKNAIKVDDSISGILEGKKAKVITIGLISTGISVGIKKNEFQNLSLKEKSKIKKTSTKAFRKVKTDYIIEDLFEFTKLLREKFNIY